MADDAITVPLTEEIAAFEKARENLEKTYPSKFVLFKGSDLIGARDTLDAARSRPSYVRPWTVPH